MKLSKEQCNRVCVLIDSGKLSRNIVMKRLGIPRSTLQYWFSRYRKECTQGQYSGLDILSKVTEFEVDIDNIKQESKKMKSILLKLIKGNDINEEKK